MKKYTKQVFLLNVFFISIIVLLIYFNNYITIIKNKFFHVKKDEITCHDASSTIIYESLGYKWEKVTCAAEFSPRDGAGALVFKDSLRLIGGWNPLDKNNFPLVCNNEVWSSLNGVTWSRTKENTFINKNFNKKEDWEGRHSAGYAVYKDRMWIIGGDENQGHFQFDVWNSSDGKKWKYVNLNSPVPWGPRVLQHTVVFKNKIWIMGGQTIPQFAESKEKFYNDVWNTEDGINWSLVSKDIPWEAREYHDTTVFDNTIWVIGGVGESDIKNRNDVWFSKNGIDWQELPNTPWKKRHASSIFIHNNSLFVIAGNNMEPDVWKFTKI